LALFVPGAISEGARWLEACGALGAAQLKQGLRSRAAGDAEAAGSGSEMGKRGLFFSLACVLRVGSKVGRGVQCVLLVFAQFSPKNWALSS
jgi:hypothetical protein